MRAPLTLFSRAADQAEQRPDSSIKERTVKSTNLRHSARFVTVSAVVCLIAGCSGPARPLAGKPAKPQPAAVTESPTPTPSGATVPTAPLAPVFDPSNFVSVIDNPYYPLKPGMKWIYQGERDGVTQRDTVQVPGTTTVIDGVPATVVTDVATASGKVLEKTEDWFAQDRQGNVWYLGEQTASYDNGNVDTSGSWTSGVKGGRAGIIMPAKPAVTDSYRQEYLRGEAEDTSWLVQDRMSVKVPAGKYAGVMRSLEFSRLEPDVVDTKFYAPGVGIIREASLSGPKETADLISFTSK
jgi:hypothetical protein